MHSKPAPSRDSKGQVHRLLEVLSRHAEVIADALDGASDLTGRGYDAGVTALVDINALMALDEGQFQLNPRIRSFLSEQLAQFSAFQNLTRITEQIHAAQIKWAQICDMKSTGDVRDMPALEESLQYTVAEIVHYCATNLILLQTAMETEYGNVTSFKRKLEQNRFYHREVQALLADLNQLNAFTDQIEREAIGRGLFAVRQLMSTRIKSRLPGWMGQLNVVAGHISKRLFDARRLEQDVLLLSRAVLWLARNPTRIGLDIEPPIDMDPALVRPRPIRVRPQVDMMSAQLGAQQIMVNAVARMPAPRSPWERVTESVEPQYATSTVMAEVQDPLAPEDQMVMALVQALTAKEVDSPVSLGGWMSKEREAVGLEPGVWLLYASTQLHMLGMRTEFVLHAREPQAINDSFSDVQVWGAPA